MVISLRGAGRANGDWRTKSKKLISDHEYLEKLMEKEDYLPRSLS